MNSKIILLSLVILVAVISSRSTILEHEPEFAGSCSVELADVPQNSKNTHVHLLSKALEIAKSHGHKKPELVQAVLLQESDAGRAPKFRVVNPGREAYFGLMQIKLSAAKDVLKRFPDLAGTHGLQTRTDDEIKANLILNDEFNIAVGSKYLLLLERDYKFSGNMLLNAYNRGPGGVHLVDDDFYYATSAMSKLAKFKRTRS